ncbi:MAG: hypothetical protein LBT99_03550 [Bifidobacteriaceae bacterium]|jgi:hypothetical protein|nr:hypothetical protein [Bifidobacteriaceae bacterium]
MVNVDKCIRELEQALCSDNFKNNVNNIYQLPNREKVTILRNKKPNQISDFIVSWQKYIKNAISYYYYNNLQNIDNIKLNKSSNNNKIGADLFHELPQREIINIEIKFGTPTAKNIGMPKFAKIFGTDIFSNALTLNVRKQWQELYKKDKNIDNQYNRLHTALKTAVTEFIEFMKTKNNTLFIKEQAYLENEVLDISNNNKSNSYYIKISFENNQPKIIDNISYYVGKWFITKAEITSKDKRVNIFIKNRLSKISIKFTLNWKNNYSLFPNKPKVPAKLGFGSPNWNVWVKSTNDNQITFS